MSVTDRNSSQNNGNLKKFIVDTFIETGNILEYRDCKLIIELSDLFIDDLTIKYDKINMGKIKRVADDLFNKFINACKNKDNINIRASINSESEIYLLELTKITEKSRLMSFLDYKEYTFKLYILE